MDSGFSSLTLDKSQDSSLDQDGSFQELLLSASRGNDEPQSVSITKRRSRLQRQHRLSTLKEGGSQSDENPVENPTSKCYDHCKEDEVFADDSTPYSAWSPKCFSSLTFAKHDYATPQGVPTSRPENSTPNCVDSSAPTVTPLRTTPVNLSLTPALQLVHTMCQYKVQMFSGQSPSLKEELKSTMALAKTPFAFRTTMPLAGLIGRKMGLRKVDILTELKKRNLKHILAIIFNILNSECVYR